jgi:uncharacterized protein (UPF0276 family)
MQGISGSGLGLRSEFIQQVIPSGFKPDWFEITPENWISMPFYLRETFTEIVSKFPMVCHGLSLSIGSPEPLNRNFLKDLKNFLDNYNLQHYSEHLSFSSFEGSQSYELLPLPMTKEMINHVADRVKEVQDILQRPLILENATYYHVPYMEMQEVDFLNGVLEVSGAKMLLDVNNVFVNATNHNFDAKHFLDQLDVKKAAYIHVAGHTLYEEENLIIDSHGTPVRSEVWDLLEYTLNTIDLPVMIERDNDVPELSVMQKEYEILKQVVDKAKKSRQKYA